MLLIRISLIVAIVAALAAGVVNFTVVKTRIDTLTSDRNDQRSAKETAQHQLAETKKTLASTQAQLTQTQSDLATAQTARQHAEDDLAKANTQIDDLNTKITKTTKERDDALNTVDAYRASGLDPKQVASLTKDLKSTQDALEVANEENAVLNRRAIALKSQLEYLVGTNSWVTLPASLKGQVMAVDPKWDFVVLNIGADQGALQNGEMLVSRDGRLVAKVIIRSVQKNRSIANFVPGWQLGEIIEGDLVIPAHPSSS